MRKSFMEENRKEKESLHMPSMDRIVMKDVEGKLYPFCQKDDTYVYQGRMVPGRLRFFFSKEEKEGQKGYGYLLKGEKTARLLAVRNATEATTSEVGTFFRINGSTEIAYLGNREQEVTLAIGLEEQDGISVLVLEISGNAPLKPFLADMDIEESRYHTMETKRQESLIFSEDETVMESGYLKMDGEIRKKEEGYLETMMKGYGI